MKKLNEQSLTVLFVYNFVRSLFLVTLNLLCYITDYLTNYLLLVLKNLSDKFIGLNVFSSKRILFENEVEHS